MHRIGERQFSLYTLLALTSAIAVLLAFPRVASGVSMRTTTILWIVTLHQIALALSFATVLWLASGRRKAVGAVLAFSVFLFWSPLLAAMIETAATGSNMRVAIICERLRIAPFLQLFYNAIHESLGYNFTHLKS